jgi:hypothetical protein
LALFAHDDFFSSRITSTEKAPIAPEDVVRAEKEKKRMDKEQRKVYFVTRHCS